MSRRAALIAGLLALAAYVAHAIEVALANPLANLLWCCNVGAALVPVGLLLRRPRPLAVGALLLLAGEPLWITDLATAGAMLYTAPLTHVGELAIALWGVRRLGLPRGSWIVATLLLAAATAAARWAGPPSENVNLAFAIPRGFEWRWPSHAAYLTVLGALVAAAMAAMERGGIWWMQRRAKH